MLLDLHISHVVSSLKQIDRTLNCYLNQICKKKYLHNI